MPKKGGVGVEAWASIELGRAQVSNNVGLAVIKSMVVLVF
jgi:hypothetical protein